MHEELTCNRQLLSMKQSLKFPLNFIIERNTHEGNRRHTSESITLFDKIYLKPFKTVRIIRACPLFHLLMLAYFRLQANLVLD